MIIHSTTTILISYHDSSRIHSSTRFSKWGFLMMTYFFRLVLVENEILIKEKYVLLANLEVSPQGEIHNDDNQL